MKKSNGVVVGCDLGDKQSEYCVLDRRGEIVEAGHVRTTTPAITKIFRALPRARVVVEVGTHSRWVAELLKGLGHEVIVANARQVQLIWKRRYKTDQTDAEVLARLGRVDASLLSPVQHRSRAAHLDLACIKSRDALVRTRTKLVNFVRGTLKPFGHRFPHCSTDRMPKLDASIPQELVPALGPVMDVIALLGKHIAAQDKQIDQLAAVAHPETARLNQVAGVGPITSLAYVLTLEDPTRFRRSRDVGSFIGLAPARDQSGASDPQKHITKAGDPLLRRLLVQCAHYTLGRYGPPSDLRAWGLAIARTGGKTGMKRAVIAVARKLSVLLHRLWVSGERYVPEGYHRAAAHV